MLRPIGEDLLLKLAPEDLATPGGILMPSTVRRKLDKYTVVAVGVFVKEICAGDTVFALPFTSLVQIPLETETLYLASENEILGVVE